MFKSELWTHNSIYTQRRIQHYSYVRLAVVTSQTLSIHPFRVLASPTLKYSIIDLRGGGTHPQNKSEE